MGAPVTVGISWIIQSLSDGERTDAVGICSTHRLFINVMNLYISCRIYYQLYSWLNGSDKEVHSLKELQFPRLQKLQFQRKYPILI